MSEDTFSKTCLATIGCAAFFTVFRSATLAVVCGAILAGWVSLAACACAMFHLHLNPQPETLTAYLFGLSLLTGWIPMSLIVGTALLVRLFRSAPFKFHADAFTKKNE